MAETVRNTENELFFPSWVCLCAFSFLGLLFSLLNFHVIQVISTARTCNCILIVLDAIKPITHKRLIEKELEGFGIR